MTASFREGCPNQKHTKGLLLGLFLEFLTFSGNFTNMILSGILQSSLVWLLCSLSSACFQGSFHSLDDNGYGDLVADSSRSKDADVASSLDTTRCFGDSEPDDSCWSCQTEKLAHTSRIFCPPSSTDSHRVNGANPFVAWFNPPSKCARRV